MGLGRKQNGEKPATWRQYQKSLKKTSERKHLGKFTIRWFVILALAAILLFGLVLGLMKAAPLFTKKEVLPPEQAWSKRQVQEIMKGQSLWKVAEEPPEIKTPRGEEYEAVSTLDLRFQSHVLESFKTEHAKIIALVAMEPESGKVLVMAGYAKDPESPNPCTEILNPAASVFKVVTAAAAMESGGLNPSSVIPYNGKKHTLYKKQLKDYNNKWTRRPTLEEAFAESVNPVFGKLGVNVLGGEKLLEAALNFGFNQELGFELPLAPSVVKTPEGSFGIAETASGFNRETLMTPLHGAAMMCAVLNGGDLPEPSVISTVENQDSQIVYQSGYISAGRAMNVQTCNALKKVLVSAAVKGTARAAFSMRKRSRLLKKLTIGGKTGSINNEEDHAIRYDWFVGFAHDKQGKKKLAISSLVAHHKFIGPKAYDYAKSAIEYYFD